MRQFLFRYGGTIGWAFIAMLFVYLGCHIKDIHRHPSGNAEYIDGDTCAISATPDINLVEFQDLFIWCSTQHMEYLASQKSQ